MNGIKTKEEKVSGVKVLKGTVYIYFKIGNNNNIIVIIRLLRVFPFFFLIFYFRVLKDDGNGKNGMRFLFLLKWIDDVLYNYSVGLFLHRSILCEICKLREWSFFNYCSASLEELVLQITCEVWEGVFSYEVPGDRIVRNFFHTLYT